MALIPSEAGTSPNNLTPSPWPLTSQHHHSGDHAPNTRTFEVHGMSHHSGSHLFYWIFSSSEGWFGLCHLVTLFASNKNEVQPWHSGGKDYLRQ